MNPSHKIAGAHADSVTLYELIGDLVGALSLVEAIGAITPDAAALRQTQVRQLWTTR